MSAEAAPGPRRARWLSSIAKAVVGLAIFLVSAIAAIGLLLDTDLGHRLILDRIAAIAPDSGLRVRIGRIEGSIWGRTELRDVRLYDPEGLFAEAPQMELEWQPLAWLANRLVIGDIGSDLAIVHRLPRFDEDDRDGLGLPDFDIHIGRLDIAQLRFDDGVGGSGRTARVSGEVEFRRRRLLLDLEARVRDGGDRLDLLLDAAPDRDQFNLELDLDAPAGGLFAGLLGSDERLRMVASGDGAWRRWAGRAQLSAGGRSAGELRLGAESGRYAATGWLAPAPLLGARLAELAGPRMNLSAEGRFENGLLQGNFAARSQAMRLALRGAADLRGNSYRDVRIAFELLRPHRFLGDVAAGTRLAALLDGPFANAAFTYRLSAPRVQVGTLALDGVQASGSGRWARAGLALPVSAYARRIAGPAGPFADDARLTGSLLVAGNRLAGQNLSFSAPRVRARFALEADLGTGRYAIAGTAAGEGMPIEGLGIADLTGEWRAASNGAGASLRGSARATVRRLENGALAWASGGPLRIETGIAAGGDGIGFPGLRLAAPRLQLSGDGRWRSDGALAFEGRGRQTSLGPLSLRFEGMADRPRLALRLARPSRSLGLADVRLDVEPAAQGIGYRARGRSPLGPFSARGTVTIGRGDSAAIDVAALAVSGATARGVLRPAGGGIAGELLLGGALAGPLRLSAEGGAQGIEAELVASDARLGRIAIGSGRLSARAEVGAAGALSGRLSFDGAADRLWESAGIAGVELSGPLAIEAEIGGSTAAPSFRGSLRLAGGRLTSSASGAAIESVEANGTFTGAGVNLDRFAGRTGRSGRIAGSGTIGFGGAVDLRLETDSALLFAHPAFRARVSGPLRIRSGGDGGLVSGDLRLTGARLRLDSLGASGGSGSAGAASRWRLALSVDSERIAVEGGGLDSRWNAQLRIGGTAGAPAISGEAVLDEGSYSLFGRSYQLAHGTLRFEDEAPPNPRIDILASPASGSGPSIRIGGRARRPEIGIVNPLVPAPQEPSPSQPLGALVPPATQRPVRLRA